MPDLVPDEEVVRKCGWEKCADGWRQVFPPVAVRMLMAPRYRGKTWKEARCRDGIAALLVSAGAIKMGMEALLIPSAEWTDG